MDVFFTHLIVSDEVQLVGIVILPRDQNQNRQGPLGGGKKWALLDRCGDFAC